MYRSSIEMVGGTEDPMYVYYNADIINNNTTDTAGGTAVIDPQVRFNETRDAPLVKDASQYNFSIVRFTMDGPSADLPLFIPVIQAGTGQTNVNLTTYGAAITLQQDWNMTIGGVVVPRTLTVTPPLRYVVYAPATLNPAVAPTPRPMSSSQLAPSLIYNPALTYSTGQIVGTTLSPYGGSIGPFYQATQPVPLATPPLANPAFWSVVPSNLGQSQDLTSRYYWVYTYQNWLDLVNVTLQLCMGDLYSAFQVAWLATGTTDPFPYATPQSFYAVVNPPKIIYNGQAADTFSVYADSDGFGQRITAFTPAAPGVPGALTSPRNRLFFNSNMFALFQGLENVYYNSATAPFGATPPGYVNEILFSNKFFQNVVDYRIAPYSGVPPLGVVPLSEQKPYYVATQDYSSTSQFWTPISSVVFVSTLLPIRAEYTGQPVVLGNGNTGYSSASTQNAFTPIITDIALDLSTGGAANYKKQLYYAPTAEYRISDFLSSRVPLNNIDVSVYWKCRLDNNLYPITMANLSSVSLKLMLRRKDLN